MLDKSNSDLDVWYFVHTSKSELNVWFIQRSTSFFIMLSDYLQIYLFNIYIYIYIYI